ncbi:MAG: UDP-N-acetylmuramate dehydrogenase [Ignavibacteriaceae bacterium]
MIIKENFSLKKLNTFHLDVKTKYFAEIFSEDEIKEILSKESSRDCAKFVLGGGSNVLFTKDFSGLVIKNSISGINVIRESVPSGKENEDEVFVEAGAGVIWHDLVLFCIKKNYGGIENLSLIPGTVGAAPIQNIGAYGQEFKDVFYSLKGIMMEYLSPKTFYKDECSFGYRDSIFKRELKGKFIITSVTLKLSKSPVLNLNYSALKEEIEKSDLKEISIRNVSEAVCKIRRSKLPNPEEIGNAGSFFKNPEIAEEKYFQIKKEFSDINGYKLQAGNYKISAAWLIDKCGWKGKRIGNAGVHVKQPLVLVNLNDANGKEILELSNQIKKSILEKFGISLEEEVNIV